MELCVDDKTTAEPTADDIRRALDATPHPEDWYLTLESADGAMIDAVVLPDGAFEVTGCDTERELKSRTPIDAKQLSEVLLKLLAGDRTWSAAPFWIDDAADAAQVSLPAAPAGGGSKPPAWALATVIGSIVFVVLTSMLGEGSNTSWREALPFGNSDYFWVGLIAPPMVVLLVVAVLVMVIEVRRAAGWPTAAGRVMRCGTVTHRQRHAGDATTVVTVPDVEYEFAVGGRTFRGNRIGIGEDSGGANTAATLGRYPVGAVVSVHYDPANPRNCVLEREVPEGFGKGLVVIVAIVGALAAGGWWLIKSGPDLLAAHLPGAAGSEGVVLFAAGFGLVVLLFFIASLSASRRAAGWPLVRGTVLLSDVERIEKREEGRTRISYAPVVEYRYRVNDVDYASRQITLGVALSSGEGYARRVAARYPKDGVVDVHYDPANPASAALENPTRLHWLLLLVALACFALAAHASDLI